MKVGLLLGAGLVLLAVACGEDKTGPEVSGDDMDRVEKCLA